MPEADTSVTARAKPSTGVSGGGEKGGTGGEGGEGGDGLGEGGGGGEGGEGGGVGEGGGDGGGGEGGGGTGVGETSAEARVAKVRRRNILCIGGSGTRLWESRQSKIGDEVVDA